MSLAPYLLLAHLIGLALGVGGATVKLVLLLRCRADRSLAQSYVRVGKLITRHIVIGMVLLTGSGIGWLVIGFPVTQGLVLKLVAVAVIWILGPVIDNVFEPRFCKLAPAPGEPATPEFIRVQGRHLTLEILATLLFYAIVVGWVLG